LKIDFYGDTVTTRLNWSASAIVWQLAVLVLISPMAASGQVPETGEVRQLVTFSFLPGKSADAIGLYVDHAIPLYEKNPAMKSFRGFREVESPVPLDLIVVSAFDGMAGMDASNSALRGIAAEAGTSIGALYGGISALSSGHTDQFVEMLPALGTGDATSKRLTAFVWYQVIPGASSRFEAALAASVVPAEKTAGTASSTGRFLISDGWHYLRMLAFDSLGEYEAYWSHVATAGHGTIDALTTRRREVVVAGMPDFEVR
jgi:hypothetical protein